MRGDGRVRGALGCSGWWGIATQGDSFAELDGMIADAVAGYFEPKVVVWVVPNLKCSTGRLSIVAQSKK